MNTAIDDSEFQKFCEQIDALSEQRDSLEFESALIRLEAFAQGGSVDAAELLAEMLAYDGRFHDAAKAYKWYFIALSSPGYSTEFNDQNGLPPHYCGPVASRSLTLQQLASAKKGWFS